MAPNGSNKATNIKNLERERKAFVSRAVATFAILVGALLLLFARMVWLMVYQHDEYRTRSDENRIQTVPILPPRGLIYDRDGDLLADNQPAFSIVVVTEHAGDVDATLSAVAALVDITAAHRAAFRERLAKKRRPLQEIPLKVRVDPRERAVIEVNRHRLPGVAIAPTSLRAYRHGPHMAHAVGSVRRIAEADVATLDASLYSASEFIGKRGVEAFYERSLHGRPGWRKIEVDAHGVERREISRRPPVPGQNLVLHLDAGLQFEAVAALGQRRGAVVAIDPKSGGILALVSNPSYDPNLFVAGLDAAQFAELSGSRDTPLLNRATQGLYAPGSTFKPVVGLAALALGLTDWERTYHDRGEFRLPGQRRVYRDWSWRPGNAGGQGVINLRAAVYRSSNTYFYELGSRMAVDALQEFTAQFGYGRVLALDVADTDPGVLPDSEWKRGMRGEPWYRGDTVNLAIGQGDLLATPLQLATMASILANRGRVVAPRMLKSSDGRLAEFEGGTLAAGNGGHVEGLSAADWEEMAASMVDVVHLGNQGYRRNGIAWFHIGQDIEYTMAGKSGTAQVVGIPQGAEYDDELLDEYHRKHAWFIAFAPAEDPQIALAVLVENGGGGSSVAGPVARAVLDAYLLPKMQAAPPAAVAEAQPAREVVDT